MLSQQRAVCPPKRSSRLEPDGWLLAHCKQRRARPSQSAGGGVRDCHANRREPASPSGQWAALFFPGARVRRRHKAPGPIIAAQIPRLLLRANCAIGRPFNFRDAPRAASGRTRPAEVVRICESRQSPERRMLSSRPTRALDCATVESGNTFWWD